MRIFNSSRSTLRFSPVAALAPGIIKWVWAFNWPHYNSFKMLFLLWFPMDHWSPSQLVRRILTGLPIMSYPGYVELSVNLNNLQTLYTVDWPFRIMSGWFMYFPWNYALFWNRFIWRSKQAYALSIFSAYLLFLSLNYLSRRKLHRRSMRESSLPAWMLN